eukprot:scaffold41817_cov176-Amphora_coffeaeformis.AAC.2
MYSTAVVTAGHAGKPKPAKPGMGMPNTKMRPNTKFNTKAIPLAFISGCMMRWDEKNCDN